MADFFDASFSTVRRNPRGTILLAVVVLVVAIAIPTVVSVVVGAAGGYVSGSRLGSGELALTGLDIGLYAALFLSSLFVALANLVIAGLIVPVVNRAALGEYIAPGDAWRQARGSLLRLVGLALLEFLVATVLLAVLVGGAVLIGFAGNSLGLGIGLGVLGFVLAVVGLALLHVRLFLLAAPALVSERIGVTAAIGRAFRLSRGQFWRIFGTFLLMALVSGIVQQVISVPFGLIGGALAAAFATHGGLLASVLASNLASVVSGAVTIPFTSAVVVLQYLDQRFRKEGFDVELITYVESRQGTPPGQAR